MHVDLSIAKRTRRPARPEFATLVAVTVARQSASLTAQLIAATESGPAGVVTLVDPFGTARTGGMAASGCFNSDVAALLTACKRT